MLRAYYVNEIMKGRVLIGVGVALHAGPIIKEDGVDDLESLRLAPPRLWPGVDIKVYTRHCNGINARSTSTLPRSQLMVRDW